MQDSGHIGGHKIFAVAQAGSISTVYVVRFSAASDEFVTVHGTDDDPRLPANGVDVVLVVNTYHEFKAFVDYDRSFGRRWKALARMPNCSKVAIEIVA